MGLFGFGKKEKDKMKDGLEKTRTGFWGNIMNTLTGSKIDDDLYDELEEQLILADVGGEVAIKLVDKLRDRVNEKGLKTGEQASDELRDLIADEMRPEAEMDLSGTPAVILVIGVNGVGKTTSIAKLADFYTRQGKKVMLAAGDTFRAAAAEQLCVWAERADVPVVKHNEGADPAAVLFDAVQSAAARGYDMVICDEFGYVSCDKAGAEMLFNHLSLRTDKKTTVITTNLAFNRWDEIIADKVLVTAMVDRLTHKAILLNMTGKSYRMKETQDMINKQI